MRITKLVSQHFKGVSGTTKLDQFTLIHGRNGTGKTSRLLQIICTLIGKVPKPDGSLYDITKLASSPEGWSTEVFLEGAWVPSIRRFCAIGPKATVTGVRFPDRLSQPSVRQANKEIADAIGNFAPMFNLAEFRGLSPEKMRTAVVDLCSEASDGVIENLRARVAAAINAKPDVTVDSQSVAAAMVEVVPDGNHTVDTITDCIEAGKKLQNAARAKVKVSVDRRQALADEKGKLLSENKLGHGLAFLKESVAEHARVREELKGELGKIAGKADARTAAGKAMKTADENVAIAAQNLTDHVEGDAPTEHAKMIDLCGDLVARIRAIPLTVPDWAEPLAKATEAAKSAEGAWNETEEKWRKATADYDRADNHKFIVNDAIETRQNGFIAIIDGLVNECIDQAIVAAIDDKSQELRNAWQELSQFVLDSNAELGVEKLQAEVKDLQKKQDELDMVAGAAEAAGAATREARKRTAEELCLVQEVLARDQAEYNDRYQRAQAWQGQRDALVKTIAEYDAAETKLCDQSRAAETAKAAAETLLDDLDDGDTADVEALNQRYTKADESHRKAANEVEQAMRVAVIKDEYTKEAASGAQVAKDDAAIGLIIKVLRQVRDDNMAALLDPLTSGITTFLNAAGWKGSAFVDLVNTRCTATFVMGWKGDRGRTALDALSGGESAIYCAALVTALVRMADPPLKLLLLDCGEVDSENLARLLHSITEAAPEFQAVVASHTDAGPVLEGWKTINLDKLP